MAYDPTVPPSLITQGIGGTVGLRWFALMWIDPIADVLVPGYISNATDIGLRAGDGFIYKDVNRGEWDHYDLIVLSVDDNGAATIAFPEVPEEALPFSETVDFEDANTFVVLYQGGRQTRVEIVNFGLDTIANASQAEAEAGSVNDKRMTPLRTFQAITVRLAAIGTFIAALTGKAAPAAGDALMMSDSADSGAAKKLSFANLMAWLSTNLAPTPSALGMIRRNADNDGYEIRTPAQVAADIGVVFTKEYESAPQAITLGGLISLTHGLETTPKIVTIDAVRQSDGDGYVIGDVIPVAPHGDTAGSVAGRGLSIRKTSTQLLIRVGDTAFGAVLHATTGVDTGAAAGEWQLIVRAYA